MENKMKYLDENKSNSKIEKLTKLFNELVLEFNNICNNGFDEISSNNDLKSMCDQINILKNNIFTVLNKISQKNEIESILKKLTKNLSTKEKDFVSDAFQNLDCYDDKKSINNLFDDLTKFYNMLISKKNYFLSIINDPNKMNDENTLLLDLDSEIKILEDKIVQYKESNKHLYLNLSADEKKSLEMQKKQIDDLNDEISSYFSKIKNSNLEIKDDLNLYIEKFNEINNLYLSLKNKFNEIINNREFFLNLKFKKNLSLNEKYEVIDSKVNQIKWEYNYKLFEIKSNFEISKQKDDSLSDPKVIQIKSKIKDIESIIYSLLNEKSEYLKQQLKFILASENKKEENIYVPSNNNEGEKLLEKKLELLENQLMQQLDKINAENTSILLNVENKINALSSNFTTESVENKISHFSNEFKETISNLSKELIDIKDKVNNDNQISNISNEFKEIISNLSNELTDIKEKINNENQISNISNEFKEIISNLSNELTGIKEKVNDVDSKPDFDIDFLSEKIDTTLKTMDDKNLFSKSYLEDFIELFNSNLEKYLSDTINKIESSYKENSQTFRTEVINDSRKYKDDILNQVVDILKTNLKESNLLVNRLSNKIIDFKNDHKNFVRENNKIIFSVLKKNESEKRSIQDLLKKISDKNDEISDEAQINKLFFHNSKLLELDDLIKQQNDSFLNLLNDKEKIYFEVEKILLNSNKSEKGEDKLKRIESEINDIKIIINSKIESVEQSFKEKFDFINKDYIDEIQISNKIFTTDFEIAIFEHINTIEEKLINNFSDIKHNILSVVSQVYSEIESIKDSSLTLPELDDKLAILASKIDEIKMIEQEESVTKLNFEEIKKLLANTNISIEDKLTQINLLQNDLSKNISTELQSILNENSQYFLTDMKNTLNENANDAFLSLEDKLIELNLSQSNLSKNISNELQSILNENSQSFLTNMKDILNENTNDAFLSLEDKLVELNLSKNDLSNNISSELQSILNENSQSFLTEMKNTLNENANDAFLSLEDKLIGLNLSQNELPKNISSELQSILNENSQSFLNDMKKNLIENTGDVLESIEEKLSNINLSQMDLPRNISSELHTILDENSQSFLNDMKKNLIENTGDTLVSIEEKLSNINLSQMDLPKNISSELHAILDDNSTFFLANIKNTLNENTSETLSLLENKLIEFNLTHGDLTKNISNELQTILDENSEYFLTDMKKTLSENTNETLLNLEDKLSRLNLDESNLPQKISSELNTILSENSKHFLDNMKNTLNESANETLLTIEEKLSKLGVEENNLPKRISDELFSVLDKNNEKLFSDLNKSLEDSKNETISISNKIYDEINKFKNDQLIFIERNRNWFKTIIENNQKNKFYIKKLLDQINSKNEELSLELESSKLAFHNNKLSEVEELIARQTSDVSSLIEEKTMMYDEIERILTSKKQKENNGEKLYRIENEISHINSNFEDKFKSLQDNLVSKFDSLNKQYISEIETEKLDEANISKEIFNNINLIENTLLENFNSVQLNIATSIKSIFEQVELLKNKALTESEIENRLLHLVEEIKDLKKMENSISIDNDLSNADELNANYKRIAKDLYNQISSTYLNNSQEILNKIDQEFFKISDEFNKSKMDSKDFVDKIYDEINKYRNDQKAFILKNKDWFQSIINNNNFDKRQINELLKDINENKNKITDEFQLNSLNIFLNKLIKLEEIIIEQNSSLIDLVEDKERIYEDIQNILITKEDDEKEESYQQRLETLYNDIESISDNFISKINNLKDSFATKFSLVELQDNQGSLNLNDVELEEKIFIIFSKINKMKNKLFDNFDLVSNNISLTIADINKQIKQIIKTSLLEKEMRNKFFHLAQQIEDIKVFELSNILGTTNFENNNDNNLLASSKNNLLSSYNRSKIIADRLEELLKLYEITNDDEITKVSNLFYEYENQKNDLSELFVQRLNSIILTNNDLIKRINILNKNRDSILDSNKIILEINSLIDEQNNQINLLSPYRNSTLESIEKKILFVKDNNDLNEPINANDLLANEQELIDIKIDDFKNDLLTKFNSINISDLTDNNSLEEISFVGENLVINWNNIKEILINDFDLIKVKIVSLKENLLSFIKVDSVLSDNVKKMSNNLNYDLKLIDDISMKNIIVLENKRKEIDDFYRKLKYLGKKY